MTDIISKTLAIDPLVLVTLPPPSGPELAKLFDSPFPIFLSFFVGLAVLLKVSNEFCVILLNESFPGSFVFQVA